MAAKILFLDIETTPLRGYTWGMWEENVIEVDQDWFILSFSAQWDNGPIKVYALPDYKGYTKNKSKDLYLIEELYKLLNEADIVVAHNGDRFDIKKINARFAYWGFIPPSPYKTVDTLKIARRYFAFSSNKLDDIARYLGIGRKLPTEGKHTWLGCMNGDPKSWATMKKYNKHDVWLLKQVYESIQGYATNHPRVGRTDRCPNCDGNLQARGFNITRTGRKQRYQCIICGAWTQGQLIKE